MIQPVSFSAMETSFSYLMESTIHLSDTQEVHLFLILPFTFILRLHSVYCILQTSPLPYNGLLILHSQLLSYYLLYSAFAAIILQPALFYIRSHYPTTCFILQSSLDSATAAITLQSPPYYIYSDTPPAITPSSS